MVKGPCRPDLTQIASPLRSVAQERLALRTAWFAPGPCFCGPNGRVRFLASQRTTSTGSCVWRIPTPEREQSRNQPIPHTRFLASAGRRGVVRREHPASSGCLAAGARRRPCSVQSFPNIGVGAACDADCAVRIRPGHLEHCSCAARYQFISHTAVPVMGAAAPRGVGGGLPCIGSRRARAKVVRHSAVLRLLRRDRLCRSPPPSASGGIPCHWEGLARRA